MSNPKRTRCRTAGVWIAAIAPWVLALAGCGGWSSPSDSSGMQVDLRPIVAQMSDQPANGHFSPDSVSSPGNTATTTDVKSVILGAIVIGFQDTPIGPSTAITQSMQDNLTQAGKNSVKFVKIIQLPNSDPFVELDVPPPAATHWQLVAVGTRDVINVLDDVGDNSPIYYGFNVDSNKNPFFLSGSDIPGLVTVTLQRSCVAGTPPNGCAAYKEDRTADVTGESEILSISINGNPVTAPGSLAYPAAVRTGGLATGACAPPTGCTPAYVASQLALATGLGSATTAEVEATHQLSNGQVAPCSTDTTAANLRLHCTSQFYSTSF